ncbi:MAG: restriction endonuclease subunit S [Scytonematopsis contorta HA4267-MV1]|jgi:type I restriction enzyme S subunit|nr:restriction endonuclease subunit S [Scytonematopsis contorta HA4267-MV1]
MHEWKKAYLGDILQFQRGFDITSKDRQSGDIPIVSSSGVTGYHSKAKVKRPGVVIGRKGTLGTVHYINSDFWAHDTTLWVKDFKGNHPRFIYYLLKVMQLENYDVGASNPTLNRNHIHKIRLNCPPLYIQKKIAAILSAYDDLIENNNRRIALLEKMAEEIYREWFVRLRFPGYEQVTCHKGVPEGWNLIKIEKAFKIIGGGTPSKEESRYWNDGNINWYTPSDITSANGIFLSSSSLKCTEEGLNNSSARLFPAYSIMMTSRATIGAIGVNVTTACTNQGFINCIPNENYPLFFLYHWLKLNKTSFELLSSGATFSELSKSTFKKMNILTPNKELVHKFNNNIMQMFKRIEILLSEVTILKQTRSRLLTRLISGKLSVENLNIQFPPNMLE